MDQSTLRVFKFGGASIRDAEAIRNVAHILQGQQGASLLVVVSAMGKTTNALEGVVDAYHNGNIALANERLGVIRDQHLLTVKDLFGDIPSELADQLNDLLVSVEWVLDDDPNPDRDYDYDQIVPLGELMSSRIVAAYLNQQALKTNWVDARDIIITDNIFREGQVQWQSTQERARKLITPLLEEEGFVLTQGFIGSTTENFTTTLGREGSDYTAAIFSHCLDAE
ncbi:MAG: aspartate kinase, partial [Bacteroidota bacterium]